MTTMTQQAERYTAIPTSGDGLLTEGALDHGADPDQGSGQGVRAGATTIVPRPAPPAAWSPPPPPGVPRSALLPPAPRPMAAAPAPTGPPLAPAGFGPMSPHGPIGTPGAPYAPGSRPSSGGRTVGIVIGAIAAVVVLLVILLVAVGALYGSTADPAPAAPAAPSSAPAAPSVPPNSTGGPGSTGSTGSTALASLAPAGKRLDAARTTLDQELTRASERKSLPAFRDAFRRFAGELEAYKAATAGVTVPPGEQGRFTMLKLAVDAALADSNTNAGVDSAKELSAPTGRFDQNWKTVVTLHNQIIDALPAA